MTATLLVPLIVVIASALVYVLASNAKLVELARLTFLAAMLVLIFVTGQHVIHF